MAYSAARIHCTSTSNLYIRAYQRIEKKHRCLHVQEDIKRVLLFHSQGLARELEKTKERRWMIRNWLVFWIYRGETPYYLLCLIKCGFSLIFWIEEPESRSKLTYQHVSLTFLTVQRWSSECHWRADKRFECVRACRSRNKTISTSRPR